jgi:glycosyltransferase involved in cell wall biosynthesis
MLRVSALLHTKNDAQRIGRALDSLRPCDEVLVIDHDSEDETAKIARDHGAKVKKAVPGVEDGTYATDTTHDWVLCLLPCEALSEGLEASLLSWKHQFNDDDGSEQPSNISALAFALRHETEKGWENAPPQTRLVNRQVVNWTSALPPETNGALVLPGDLLHFLK